MKKMIAMMLPILILAAFAFRNTNTMVITGTITDQNGNAMAAVSVGVKGMKAVTISDQNGVYRISVSDGADILVFKTVGAATVEEKINGRRLINVIMARSATELNTVTVVTTALGIKRVNKSLEDDEVGYSSGTVSANGKYFSAQQDEPSNTEEYSNIAENGFHKVSDDPLSTFSIDVDAASYSNVRRFLNEGQLPPAGAVRTEEMINYFKYQYPQPTGKDPFSINTEISDCPWNTKNKLVLIGLQGKNIPTENLPASNLVFLIDVSGSMMEPDKLPLVQSSLKMLTDQLREKDRISIVVYAGNAGLVLPATSGANKTKIKEAIDALEAGGSTAGGAGIQLAYKTAQENFMKDGNNRIILCTDGDFNVGESSDDVLVRLIEKERDSKVYLTVLGFGMGNYKDSKMEQLADKGNGNHAYIDGISEAKKVLVSEFGGTLFTIAKDVKLQLEFNPAKVAGYRLIGYENRLLNKEDFNDDKKDAGELGSGHTVTALYEIIPAGVESEFLKTVDPLKYQKNKTKNIAATSFSDELLTVKFRYKAPDKDSSDLIVHAVKDAGLPFNKTSDNFRFATAVADFAMLLRGSAFKGSGNYSQVLNIANNATGTDKEGYRKEFISLVKKADEITDSKAANN
jgi:Ca-activated chloride channel family protein